MCLQRAQFLNSTLQMSTINQVELTERVLFFQGLSRMCSPCDTYRINMREGATISSSDRKVGMHDRTFGIFLYCVNKLPNFCQMLPCRQDEKKLFFTRTDEGKGARGLGKGCDFHLQRTESDLWCRSGITPLKSELWINSQMHLSPQSCHLQG